MRRLQWQGAHRCPWCRSDNGFELEGVAEPVRNKNNHLWPLLASIICKSCGQAFKRNCRIVG